MKVAGLRVASWSRLLALLGLALLGVGPCDVEVRRADVNLDGYVDIYDATLVGTCLALPPGTDPRCARADVDADGDVDTDDFIAVQQHFGAVLFNPAPPGYVPASVYVSRDGILHLHDPDHNRIQRWSLPERRPIAPILLGSSSRYVAYSSENDSLYVAYQDGRITRFDASFPAAETRFATLSSAPAGLATAGAYVVAVGNFVAGGGFSNTYATFASDGRLVSSVGGYRSSTLAWSSANRRLYHFRDQVSPDDLLWEAIDASGKFTANGESPYHGDYAIAPPIRVSRDGARVLLGSGDLYDGISLQRVAAMSFAPKDGLWLDGRELLTLESVGGATRLRHWGSDQRLYDVHTYPGDPLRVLDWDAGIAVLTLVNGSPTVQLDVVRNDADGDGVPNAADAFPMDVAASVDSDGDGAPDAWNPGYGPGDSSQGLVLDSFPHDSTCWLAEHARPGHPDVCDLARSIPVYTPTQVVADDAGTFYLLSPENDRIYRWSLAENYHLAPIVVGDNPQAIGWSAANRRLYVGYGNPAGFGSGKITQIDPSDPSLHEQSFATTSSKVQSIQAVGAYVYASDGSGQHTFAANGALISDFGLPVAGPVWSAPNARMYSTSSIDVSWVRIDPATGRISTFGGSTYRGAYPVSPPVRVSRDGRFLWTASGNLYDANTLQIKPPVFPDAYADALWLADGSIVTLRDDGHGRTLLEHWDTDQHPYNYVYYAGTPLRVVETQGGISVVTRVDGRPAFFTYVPSADADGDGILNLADDFPLDPAASLDSDRDGAPDAWNPGSGPADSTEGLALDAFPHDSACQLAEQALAGQPGVCDIARTIPVYTPKSIEADAEGTLYLLSPENQRIYRWSLDEDAPLNPIPIGAGATQLAYSAENDRLYVGYANGDLTQIDLAADPLQEQPFALFVAAIRTVQTAGRFVYVMEGGRHHTYAPNGVRIGPGLNINSSDLATWSAANSRMYFTNDGSPTDVQWERIDPVTGVVTATGDSPYHGEYRFQLPLRVSRDGRFLLVGSGDILDGVSLVDLNSLPYIVTDALWLADGTLVTIRDAGGRTRLEHWDAGFHPYNYQDYAGTPLRLLESQGEITVVTEVDGRPLVRAYAPTNDADRDGVANDDDAFPLDASASQDSDGDGYPDAWNPGYGPEDSSQGLALDFFPHDSACQLAEQALPDQPDRCDIERAVPAYTPTRIEADDTGTLYLLSRENDRIYRLSIASGGSLNPILVGDEPQHLAYSSDLNRLYVGYTSGVITSIDLGAAVLRERHFATLAYGVKALQTAGRFVFAIDERFHYTFAPDGTRLGWRPSVLSGQPTWSEANSRMYYNQDSTSSNDVQWDRIDPSSGLITAYGESPYPGGYWIKQPIRVSPDGHYVLLGSGGLYDGLSLLHLRSLPQNADALWLDDGRLLLLDPYQWWIEQWTRDFRMEARAQLTGTPLRIVESGGEIAVVTLVNGRPFVQHYEVTDDGDGDGVPNEEDDFPFDPAASRDTDHDGYPDAWNPGYGPDDSTDHLVVDAFPDDMACQLPEHGVDGVCDFVDVLPRSIEQPFCDHDTVLPAADSGSRQLFGTSDFVPLCDGWMLIGEQGPGRISVRNMVNGRQGAFFSLPSNSGDLEIDEGRKRLFVALPDQLGLGELDLLTGHLRVIDVPSPIQALASRPDGGLLIAVQPQTTNALPQLFYLAADASTLAGPWNIPGTFIRWNAIANELDVGGYSTIYRYAFDPTTGVTLLQSNPNTGSPGQDLAISRDGLHLAFATTAGNGSGAASYAVFDYVASQITSYRGVWPVGRSPRAVAFDRASARVITGNGAALKVYDVATFAQRETAASAPCDYVGHDTVAFSRGGTLAIGRQACFFGYTSSFTWFVTH